MEKVYNPKQIEKDYYKIWENRDYFEVDYSKDKNFCIMMPPPNVTGSLHIGHALTFTLQDIMVRYKNGWLCYFMATRNRPCWNCYTKCGRKTNFSKWKYKRRAWKR
jgi:valyl-tRNA synthetase